MKIGSKVKTNHNGIRAEGVIIEKKVIKYFDTDITLFKIDFGVDYPFEWVNKIYLKDISKE